VDWEERYFVGDLRSLFGGVGPYRVLRKDPRRTRRRFTNDNWEYFADMFVGWVWNRWELSNSGLGWSPKGQERADFMASHMDNWIYEIVSKRRSGIGQLLSVINP
jgi:hypothetical protein